MSIILSSGVIFLDCPHHTYKCFNSWKKLANIGVHSRMNVAKSIEYPRCCSTKYPASYSIQAEIIFRLPDLSITQPAAPRCRPKMVICTHQRNVSKGISHDHHRRPNGFNPLQFITKANMLKWTPSKILSQSSIYLRSRRVALNVQFSSMSTSFAQFESLRALLCIL